MALKVRILGYNINLEDPKYCPYCSKKIKAILLNRVVDTTKNNLSYILVCKCPSCYEIFFTKYDIGDTSKLSMIEKNTKDVELKPSKIIK